MEALGRGFLFPLGTRNRGKDGSLGQWQPSLPLEGICLSEDEANREDIRAQRRRRTVSEIQLPGHA